MSQNLLVFLFVAVVVVGVLCSKDAPPNNSKKLPGGQRTNCESFGRESSNRSICIKQTGMSGKLTISLGKNIGGENDPNTFEILFDAIRELDANGNKTGTSGGKKGKHSFENFTNLEFDYSDLVNTSYEGIAAVAFNFSATIPGPNATLNVPIYIFKDNGTLNLCNDETIDLVRRMVKYNIELYNWDFCKSGSGCGNGEIGEFVELVITIKNIGKGIKGKKQERQAGKKRKATKFFFGRNSISFPSAVSSDGSCREMPEEYPALKSKGNKAYSVTFRFPKFENEAIYDPAVNFEENETPPSDTTTIPPTTNPTTGCSKPLPSFAAVLILGAFLRLFF